jgi:hypothetical protein
MQSHGHRYFVKSNDYFVTVTKAKKIGLLDYREAQQHDVSRRGGELQALLQGLRQESKWNPWFQVQLDHTSKGHPTNPPTIVHNIKLSSQLTLQPSHTHNPQKSSDFHHEKQPSSDPTIHQSNHTTFQP